MLTAIHPKLPMRRKSVTKEFYLDQLGFEVFGVDNYDAYLMIQKDGIQVHFFEFRDLNPLENYGQVYIRTNDVEKLYRQFIENGIQIHPAGRLEIKPWGMKEFAILDPDHNLLTFGQEL